MQLIADNLTRHQKILTDIGAFICSDLVAKITRLVLLIIMARELTPVQIGITALALSTSELLKGLTENGVSQKLIAAPASQNIENANTAFVLGWAWCSFLFFVHIVIAAILLFTTNDTFLPALIVILGAQLLFMPQGLVNCALAIKAKKLKKIAGINTIQIVSSNMAAIILLLIIPSPLSIVVPKLLTSPIWLILMQRLHPWEYNRQGPHAQTSGFIKFGLPILATEALKIARQHADKFLVVSIAGVEFLGIYYFCFNAGMTLALSLTAAFGTVLFPNLCAHEKGNARDIALRKYILGASIILTPIILLQSSLAPIYVPLVFGSHWEGIAPAVSIISLAAIPLFIWTAISQWLRSTGKAYIELIVSFIITIALIINIVLSTDFGLKSIAIGFTTVHFLILGLAALICFPHAPIRNKATQQEVYP